MPDPHRPAAVYVGPVVHPDLVAAVAALGPVVDALADAEVVIWTDSDPDSMSEPMPPGVRWVQLPAAGVERWVRAGKLDTERVWTSMAGVYASTVAEHALAMLLAGVRGLIVLGRWHSWRRTEAHAQVGEIAGSTVAVVGAGAIGRRLMPALHALGARVEAVNRSGRPVPEADTTHAVTDLETVLGRSDHVIVAAPETDATRGLLGAAQLRLLRSHSWLVNVGRSGVIEQTALVQALQEGWIAGAALDVTDPEPLPADHVLWRLDNVLITPHTANPPAQLRAAMIRHVAQNVRRYHAGEPVLTPIDPILQY